MDDYSPATPQNVLQRLMRAARGSAADVLDVLAGECLEVGAYQELFEVRLMQARLRAGLAIDAAKVPDRPEEVRRELEDAYQAACVETGRGLLAQQNWREAWRYLKVADRSDLMRAALLAAPAGATEDDQVIEIALHEQVCPQQGFRWLLRNYGTCNGVTTLDSLGGYLPADELAGCVEILIDWVAEELATSLRAAIEQQERVASPERDLLRLIANRSWLFDEQASHVDASHLAAVVRWARWVDCPQAIKKAAALAEYGSRLHESMQYPDAPPFEQVYASHLLFFRAQLGESTEEAVTFFLSKAEGSQGGTIAAACLEAYLLLLSRIGRTGDALREWKRLAGPGAGFSAQMPHALTLARAEGEWDAYEELMIALQDPLGLAAGRVARGRQ